MRKIIFFPLISLLMMSACVSKKKCSELQSFQQQQYDSLQSNLSDCQSFRKESDAEIGRLKTEIDRLQADIRSNEKQIYAQNQEIESLKTLNTELTERLGNSKTEEEVKLLLADLQKQNEKLLAREDELRKLENQLSQNQITLGEKQRAVEEQQKALDEQTRLLTEQSNQLKELTEVINAKEQAMAELKNKISKALVGLEGNGIAITHKNNRIYVSLEEQLLFKTGQWNVDPKGVAAIDKLSNILAENTDIHILVEGHTDDVPYNGSGQIIDNWDLSTKRATAIVRILLKNKGIAPIRITAAGRAEYLPVDSEKTPEARQKNRRTEIVLSPNLDEIMEVLNK